MSIQQQDQAYKRGLVLGLTMAEIVMLVLFTLLMVLTAVIVRERDELAEKDRLIAELEGTVEVDPEDLKTVAVLKEYWETYGPKNQSFRDYFSELVLQVQQLDRLRAELEQLVELNRELAGEARLAEERSRRIHELERALGESKTRLAEVESWIEALAEAGLDPASPDGREKLEAALTVLESLEGTGQGAGDFIAELAELRREAGDLRGKLVYYKRRYGQTPCWHDDEWSIDYTFEVKLTSAGYLLRAVDQPRHQDHPIMPMVARVTTGREIPPAQFIGETMPLYVWSQKHDCRFFVIVYDGTAEHEKRIFKERFGILEGHFYKLDRTNVAPPF